MANRVRLAKAIASGNASASVRIRAAKPPFYVECHGGGVTLQHTVDGYDVTDANADWRSLGTIANDDAIVVTHPLYRVRCNVTSGTATVDLLEYRGATA